MCFPMEIFRSWYLSKTNHGMIIIMIYDRGEWVSSIDFLVALIRLTNTATTVASQATVDKRHWCMQCPQCYMQNRLTLPPNIKLAVLISRIRAWRNMFDSNSRLCQNYHVLVPLGSFLHIRIQAQEGRKLWFHIHTCSAVHDSCTHSALNAPFCSSQLVHLQCPRPQTMTFLCATVFRNQNAEDATIVSSFADKWKQNTRVKRNSLSLCIQT